MHHLSYIVHILVHSGRYIYFEALFVGRNLVESGDMKGSRREKRKAESEFAFEDEPEETKNNSLPVANGGVTTNSSSASNIPPPINQTSSSAPNPRRQAASSTDKSKVGSLQKALKLMKSREDKADRQLQLNLNAQINNR